MLRTARTALLAAFPLAALSLTGPVLAAPQFDTVDVAWERALISPTYEAFQPIEVEAAPDGGVLVVGLARQLPLGNFGLPGDMVFMKFNENGDLEWSDTLDSPSAEAATYTGGRFADAVVDDAGRTFILVSRIDSSVLRCYAANGGIHWERILPLRGLPAAGGWFEYNAAFLGLQPSGHVVVGGLAMQGAYPRSDVRAYDTNGVEVWEWRGNGGVDFASTAQSFPRGMSIGPDGTVYMHGQSDGPFYQHVGQISALDPNGNFLWTEYPGPAGVTAVTFDSLGRPVTLTRSSFGGFNVTKYQSDGTAAFSSNYSEAGYFTEGSCIALDAFDRIYVGGGRVMDGFGAKDATLFRLDAAGAFLGLSSPSVQGIAQDGSFQELHVTTRNDVVALGFSRTGIDDIILARFAPDGSERWARRRRGFLPQASGSTAVGLGLTVDPRGNLFTLAEAVESGFYPNQVLGLDLVKHVQNGPASNSYCGPAVPNSTGSPATIQALGPRLVSADNITLRADQIPANSLTLLLASRTQGNATGVGGGQGTLCLGGSIGRFFGPGQVRIAGADQSATLQLTLGDLPQPNGSVAGMAGESWNFQAWYRDANPGLTSNLTDAVEVTLQ
jgi:hypothetical protein